MCPVLVTHDLVTARGGSDTVNVGKRTAQLAAADSVTETERDAIRRALGPTLEHLQHDLSLASDALGGPDPEYALFLFSEILAETPAAVHNLEAALLAARPVRVAA